MLVPIISGLDIMKECHYSANDIAEAMFREVTRNSNADIITRQQFDSLTT